MFTTTAIILQLRPHSDRAHILHAYTRASGRAAFLLYGVGSRRKRAGVYAPFSLVELTVREGRGGQLPTVEQATLLYTPTQTQTDIRRQTVALFLSELISHTLSLPMQDEPMFDFLSRVVRDLDQASDPENVHLRAMIGLSEQLGFAIDQEQYPLLCTMPDSRAQRQEQLRQLCAYYAEHVDSWRPLSSLDILTEIFD